MNKKKVIIPVVIIVLISLLVLLSVFVVYPKFIKNNTKDKQQVDNKKLYEKYKDIVWAETSTELYHDGQGIKISNNKLECDVEFQNICDVVNNANINVSKIVGYSFYGDFVYLLSNDSKAYKVINDYSSSPTINQILENYEIIDMSKIYRSHKMAWSNIDPLQEKPYYYKSYPYFLTSDGKLISEYEYTFEEENRDFIDNRCFWYHGIDNVGLLCLYYNSDGYLSYRGESRNKMVGGEPDFSINYKEMKDNSGKQIIAKYIYDEWNVENPYFREKVLVVDKNDDLYSFEYINDTFVTSYIGKVKTINYSVEPIMVAFNLNSGEEYKAYTSGYYLDVVNNDIVYFNDLDNENTQDDKNEENVTNNKINETDLDDSIINDLISKIDFDNFILANIYKNGDFDRNTIPNDLILTMGMIDWDPKIGISDVYNERQRWVVPQEFIEKQINDIFGSIKFQHNSTNSSSIFDGFCNILCYPVLYSENKQYEIGLHFGSGASIRIYQMPYKVESVDSNKKINIYVKTFYYTDACQLGDDMNVYKSYDFKNGKLNDNDYMFMQGVNEYTMECLKERNIDITGMKIYNEYIDMKKLKEYDLFDEFNSYVYTFELSNDGNYYLYSFKKVI